MMRLRDAGVPISEKGTSKKDQAAQAQINEWARESGLLLTHISRICSMSIGENHDAARLAEAMRT